MKVTSLCDSNWYRNEFADIDFGDLRLTDRFFQVAARFSANPDSSINACCETWKEAKGAYRFFANEKVNPFVILEPHFTKTIERIKQHRVVLAIQDTTYFNFTDRKEKSGIGLIARRPQGDVLGLVCHTTFCVSANGLPLGILDQKIWARDAKKRSEQSGTYSNLPIEKKESMKWLNALRATHELAVSLTPDSQVVTVADRESDIFEFINEAQVLNENFLIRAQQNRGIEGESNKYFLDHMKDLPTKAQHIVYKGERTIKLNLRWSEITLKVPTKDLNLDWKKQLKPIRLSAIYATEFGANKKDSVKWLLLTNLKISNKQEAIEKLDWYSKRWHIENWHKVLKSGCKVEECHLIEAQRLIGYLTLFSIIAWRLYFLTHLARQNPKDSCVTVLTANEWKALYCMVNKTKKIPKKPPSVYQVTRWIAQLGGFLGRKNDGEPGTIVIWRGYQKLSQFTAMWSIMKK